MESYQFKGVIKKIKKISERCTIVECAFDYVTRSGSSVTTYRTFKALGDLAPVVAYDFQERCQVDIDANLQIKNKVIAGAKFTEGVDETGRQTRCYFKEIDLIIRSIQHAVSSQISNPKCNQEAKTSEYTSDDIPF